MCSLRISSDTIFMLEIIQQVTKLQKGLRSKCVLTTKKVKSLSGISPGNVSIVLCLISYSPEKHQSFAFVFALNPFQGDSEEIMQEDIYDAFPRELREWLKFVASQGQNGGGEEHLPQVLVVITHRELTKKYPTSFECGLRVREIMERFESIFQCVVKLVSKVYNAEARDKEEIRPFLHERF
ncbi:hypothetical protein R1sor_021940 [Riccia sorocarpa]|uniref:Uncharacterized protein n=1 Tax=Riccia sorocarpa TaxID=122646 RepID=A0ABD3GMP6_9MARC